MRPSLLAVAAVAAVVITAAAGVARAEPYLAMREGYLCSQCHVNRTGGGKRNAFGVTYSQTVMPIWKSWGSAAGKAWFVDPRMGEFLSMGADLRVQSVSYLPATSTYRGQKLTADATNSFGIAEANLYIEATLVKRHLVLYLDETVAPESAYSREAFLLLYGLPLNGYIKAGRFLLPYGLRLPDETIFVREATGFNYANQDLGVEIGAELGPLFASLAATNGTLGGNDNNILKQVVGTLGVAMRWARAGFSYSWNNGSTANKGTTRRVVGGYLGGGFGRFSLFLEADVIRDWQGPAPGATEPPATARWQWALYAEGTVLLTRGLNLRAAYDFHDPDMDVANDHRDRFTIALDATLLPFLRFGVFFYVRRDIPQKVTGNQNLLLLQLHGFL